MIAAVTGPLIVEPRVWTLVFDRKASSWWTNLVAMGPHKHVRAYAYVPFLHVWVFFDPAFSGTSIVLASNSQAELLISSWLVDADTITMMVSRETIGPPLFGSCVSQIKRLIGIRSGALRPSGLYRHCLGHGCPEVRTAAT